MLAGCAAHPTRVVRSCEEARGAAAGDRCEGFLACEAPCGDEARCEDGVLHLVHDYDCEDAGLGDAASRDAALDPCRPRAPEGSTGCHTSADCASTRFEGCLAPDASLAPRALSDAPVSCTSGEHPCPAHTRCESGPGDDGHGCVRDPCVSDHDCGCGGACLGGRCFDELGRCVVVPASVE